MKRIQFILVLAAVTFCFSGTAYTQPGRGFGEGGPPPERLERFKKMRLIEVLKLNEEESVRFFAKQNAHEEKVRDFMKERNDALDVIGDALDNASTKDLQKIADKVLEIDERIFRERQRYQEDVRKLLTLEQFAKFLLFERDFGKQVRDVMEGMVKERRHRGGRE
ncbi:MAG: hypothetical protein EPO24_11335 [Bacteroidetes bacterium]|nr:MAG: hypothetical protein EPO24_11335 [Bacteroidota bacterium]